MIRPDTSPDPGSVARMLVRVETSAARRMAATGQGRSLVIDFFASRCCTSVMVGDLQTSWLDGPVPEGLIEIGASADTRILANEALLDVLTSGQARIVEAGGLFGRSLGVRLDAPEHWLAFLSSPAARRLGGRQGPRSGLALRRA